jgi:ubiquinone/menaquinone biosynthesis C-methylase UbiE
MRALHSRTPLQLLRQNLELALTAHPTSLGNTSQPNFDRIAAIYRWAEYLSLGPFLQRTRTALLNQLGSPHNALVLGDGDGRFLEQLLLRHPHCSALAVDTSSAMLQRLHARCARNVPKASTRLTTLQLSALNIDIPLNTDLIVTHFLLDCFTQPEVEAIVTRLTSQLAPGALWLISDFALPRNALLRPFARLYITALYAAFRILTGLGVRHLPNPQSALHDAGMRLLARKSFLFGLLYTELWRRE